MKKFNISNRQNANQFEVIAEVLSIQPEYGINPIIVESDMTAQLAAEAAAKAAQAAARAELKAFDKTKIKPADIGDVLENIVVALGLK